MKRPPLHLCLICLLAFCTLPIQFMAQALPLGGTFSDVGEVSPSLLLSSWNAIGVGVSDSVGGHRIYVTASKWCAAHNAFVVEIQPDTNNLTGVAYMIPGSGEFTIWGTTMGLDSALYFSIKETRNIYRFDLRGKTFMNLGTPPFPTCANAAYSMTTGPNGTIFFASYAGTLSCGIHLGAYDPQQQSMSYLGLIDSTNRYPHTLAATDSCLYIAASTEQRKLFKFDFFTQSVRQILSPQDCCGPGFADVGRNDFGDLIVFLENTGNGQRKFCFLNSLTDSLYNCSPVATPSHTWAWPRLPDGTRTFVNGSSMKLLFKDQGNAVTQYSFSSTKSSSCANSMIAAADGNVYVGVQPMAMVKLNPLTNAITYLGNPTGTTGQIYSMATQDSMMWMASYPNGNLSVLNLNRPFALVGMQAGVDSTHNPRSLGDINNFQERPFSIAIGPDDNIYMAVKADYGGNTGSITKYSPPDGMFTIHQPYPGKAIHGLATVGNELWGVSENVIFNWDVANSVVVYDTVGPCMSGKHTRIVYSPANQTLYGICNGPDRLFWAFDPSSKQFLSQTVLDSMDSGSYSEHFSRMALGPDGLVYGHFSNFARRASYLYYVHPQSHQPILIGRWDADSSGITNAPLWNGIAFHGDDIFLPSGSHIVRFHKDYPSQVESPTMPSPLLSLVPNPASNTVAVCFLDSETLFSSWEILNLQGRRVLSGTLEPAELPGSTKIDIQHLPNGLYIFRARNEDFYSSAPLIVLR